MYAKFCFWKLLPPQQETLFFKEAKIKCLMDVLFILNTDEWKKKKTWTEIWKLRKNCLTNIFTFKSQNCVLCLCLIKILAFFLLDPTSNILICLLLLLKTFYWRVFYQEFPFCNGRSSVCFQIFSSYYFQ